MKGHIVLPGERDTSRRGNGELPVNVLNSDLAEKTPSSPALWVSRQGLLSAALCGIFCYFILLSIVLFRIALSPSIFPSFFFPVMCTLWPCVFHHCCDLEIRK